MSRYQLEELHAGTVQGFHSIFGPAWHRSGTDIAAAMAAGQVFEGPVPPEVAHRIVGWTPVSWKQDVLVDPNTMIAYKVPARHQTVVANPNSGNVINVAGEGYAVDLHNVMGEAIQAALDAECDIAGGVCLGDGAHLSLTFMPRDTVALGGFAQGAVALVGYNSSLTGAISTSLQSSSKLAVCDNTMRSQRYQAVRAIDIRRTRNATGAISVDRIRTTLEVSFLETQNLVDELEQLANIEVSTAEFYRTMDLWKPLPDEPGRSRTIAENQRASLSKLFFNDPRQVFGQSVAGLWQAHNTFQHWNGNRQADSDRMQRQAARSANGEAAKLDAEFMALVATIKPELSKTLVNA